MRQFMRLWTNFQDVDFVNNVNIIMADHPEQKSNPLLLRIFKNLMFSKKNHFSKLIQKSKNKNLKKLHNIDIFTQKKLPSKIQIAYSSSRMCNTYRPINNIKNQLPDFLVYLFLAVHNSSIGDLVTHSLTEGTFTFDITE